MRKIKLFRVEMRLAQKRLAAELGISQSHLSQIERGHRRITANLKEKLVVALGQPAELLFGDEDDD